jgi:hypothetical protein
VMNGERKCKNVQIHFTDYSYTCTYVKCKRYKYINQTTTKLVYQQTWDQRKGNLLVIVGLFQHLCSYTFWYCAAISSPLYDNLVHVVVKNKRTISVRRAYGKEKW